MRAMTMSEPRSDGVLAQFDPIKNPAAPKIAQFFQNQVGPTIANYAKILLLVAKCFCYNVFNKL
jgi:hypothetical protein